MLQSSSTSPIIDPHLSPDGTMIAYVRDDELQCTIYNLGFGDGETRQLTFGARESGKVVPWFSVNNSVLIRAYSHLLCVTISKFCSACSKILYHIDS
jgi:tricorn protease-like protein